MLDLLVSPFSEFEFMSRALVGVIAIALGSGPIGVFLMLRRMSLTGDAMAHAILPGAAVGYLIAGLSLPAMTLGGLAAGAATLAAIAVLLLRTSRRLPITQFFAASSLLIAILAVVLAGKGFAALQEAGLVPVIAVAALELGTAILGVSALTFLGFGAPPPAPEWGALSAAGRDFIAAQPWLSIIPGLVILAVVLAVNRVARAIGGER